MPDNDLWHVLAAIDSGTAALVACVFVLGGLVKGALGFGLPLATMAILPFFVAVDAALAINVVVLFLTNIAQFVQMGQMRATARRFAPVLGGILLGVPFGAVMVSSLSYDFPWLLGQKGATARHAIYGGQWRRLDRKQLGLPGPLRSMINRRLHHRA